MANKIVKGTVSKVEHEDLYDDDGIEYKKYKFKVEGKHVTLKAHRSHYISDGDLVIVELDDNYDVVAGLLPAHDYKWGKTSKLKAHKSKEDDYTVAQGTILEKRRLHMNISATGGSRKNTNFTIVLKDKSFTVPQHIAKKMKAGDVVSAVLYENYASVIYNATTNKWLGIKGPYYIAFIIFAIGLAAVVYYLHSIGNKTFVRPVTTVVVFDFFALWFGLANYFAYRHSNFAKAFLEEKLKNSGVS